MRYDEKRLTIDEEKMLARFAERDLRDDELTVDGLQRYLEGGSTQSVLYKRASYGSDASIKRILREMRAIRVERADIAAALGR